MQLKTVLIIPNATSSFEPFLIISSFSDSQRLSAEFRRLTTKRNFCFSFSSSIEFFDNMKAHEPTNIRFSRIA